MNQENNPGNSGPKQPNSNYQGNWSMNMENINKPDESKKPSQTIITEPKHEKPETDTSIHIDTNQHKSETAPVVINNKPKDKFSGQLLSAVSQLASSRGSTERDKKKLSLGFAGPTALFLLSTILKNKIFLLFIFLGLIVYGNFSPQLTNALESLNFFLGGIFSVQGMILLTSTIIPTTIILYFVYIILGGNIGKNKDLTVTELSLKFLYFFLFFMLLFFLFDNFYLGATIDEREEFVGGTTRNIFGTISEGFKGIQCSVLRLANPERYDEECIQVEPDVAAQAIQAQLISFTHNSPNLRTLHLATETDGFSTMFSLTSPIPVTLHSYSCFMGTQSREPFYTNTLNDIELLGDRVSFSYECLNLGQQLTREQTATRIFSELNFSVTNTFSLNVPMINCEHSQIRNIMEQNGFSSCDSLSLQFLQRQGVSIPQWDQNPRGGNAVRLLTNRFTEDPIRLDPSSERVRNLVLAVQSENNIGRISSATISLNLPPQLQLEGNLDTTRTAISINDEISTTYRIVSSGNFFADNMDPVFTDTISITIDANLIRRFTERYDFIVGDFTRNNTE